MALNMVGPIVQAGLRPDIGQTHYMIDSNYRTLAQGWSRPDGTGVLDLWAARNPGQVFYTPETGNQGTTYGSQAAALQAAVDAMVDFRGDILYFTPGNYSIASIVTVNVAYARWLGQEYKSPQYGAAKPIRNTTITCGVANSLSLSGTNLADGMEFAYIRMVPLTAAVHVLFSGANNGLYWHDFSCDFRGVATSASTIPFNITADNGCNDSQFDHFTALADAPQGPVFQIGGDIFHVNISNYLISGGETLGTWVTALASILTAGNSSDVVTYGPGLLQIGAAGTGVVTNLCTAVAMDGATTIGFFHNIVLGAPFAATALSGGTGADETLVNNYMETSGGTLFTA